jgi:DnaJ like chaperone protein
MQYRSYKSSNLYFLIGFLCLLFFGGIQLLFALIPLFFSLLPLIIFGYFIVKILGKISGNTMFSSVSGGLERSKFVELVIRLSAAAANSDGHVDSRELQTIRHFFVQSMRFNPSQMLWIEDLLKHALNNPVSLDQLCSEINTHFPGQPKIMMVELITHILNADGKFVQSERQFLDSVASLLHISASDMSRIFAMYGSAQETSDYHLVLGVKKGASKDTIKQAYRKACKENHPDKVAHLGEDFRLKAEEKMKIINKAYDHLMG